MATNERFDEAVSSWLQETAPARLPERVLNATFERTRKSSQQVGWRALLGRLSVPRFVPALGTAAMVVVAAALALNFYANQQGGIGTLPSPTPSASPTVAALPSVEQTSPPSLLARGNFVDNVGHVVELEATGEGSSVTGRMTVSQESAFTVDLQCTRTAEDGLIMIGGLITDSSTSIAPEGTWAGIALQRGSPVGADIWYQRAGPVFETSDCLTYLDEKLSFELSVHADGNRLDPIEGTVELGGSGPGGTNATPSPSLPSEPTLTAPPFGLAGNGVIALAKDGDILIAARPGGDLRPLVAGPEDDRSPMFSPDGTRLAFIRDTGQGSFLMLADADGTNVVQIPLEPLDLGYWSFAPDGRSLMAVGFIDGDRRVVIRPVDPAAALTVLDIPFADSSMEFSWSGGPRFRPTNPQEILVAAQLESDGQRGLYVYDLATGGIRTIVEPADEQYFQDIAWLPDGEHVIYGSRIVAADASGDQALDALLGRFSPLSNDGTRIVAERGGEGVGEGQPVVVLINGDGEPVVLACGPARDIECPSPPTDWIWSPDDSMLIGTVYHESSDEGLTETYLLVDAHTGQVTELDWRDVGTPAWQRVAP